MNNCITNCNCCKCVICPYRKNPFFIPPVVPNYIPKENIVITDIKIELKPLLTKEMIESYRYTMPIRNWTVDYSND